MILETAILDVKPGLENEFEAAFVTARRIIAGMPGHVSNQLLRCLENPGRYLLLVNWEKLEDHTEGFRKSEKYLQWRECLHRFYDPVKWNTTNRYHQAET